MNLKAKKTLIIDLENRSSEVKTYEELQPYIGGTGVALKLMQIFKEKDPIIFSIGPLNGFFPYASKTAIVLDDGGVIEDLYLGGDLSFRIKFTGVDSIIIYGNATTPVVLDINNTEVTFRDSNENMDTMGLPGKRSTIRFKDTKAYLADYFTTHEYILENNLKRKNIHGIVITGTENYEIKDPARYKDLFNHILKREKDLTVDKGIYPSCSGCPMGCGKSKSGEIGGNVLIHSLVACTYASKIYSDVGIIFSCLNVLGYDYKHEDIENLPALIEEVLRSLS